MNCWAAGPRTEETTMLTLTMRQIKELAEFTISPLMDGWYPESPVNQA